ncbi:hypothetical protein [Phenylobacterium sp.]|uniref:hypothetical protein n=1 Tax=Phenylobacterium sp. TaxID=1871053 RepID=UPI00286A6B42|nr:hypothetical protein [Phenylobacterium sp.]
MEVLARAEATRDGGERDRLAAAAADALFANLEGTAASRPRGDRDKAALFLRRSQSAAEERERHYLRFLAAYFDDLARRREEG